MARQNILLGNFVIRNVPPCDTPVDVEINVDRLGEISVTAQTDSSSGSLDITYEPSHSPEELKSLGHLTSMRLEGKTSPATGQVKRATNGGDSLKRGTPEPDTKWDNCTYAANEYMWINNLHPTSPVHFLLAKNIAKALT
ncbi:hypothetical protein CGCF415_v015093 [Colletotrichum fructicola]|nr:hypothetical protein CGCFRS4_v016081 [Colletotrichum fructicola]KAF4886622.1 hypothetical protein CGCF415_v015093 [Colletotrichum fructicola]KAF4920937.1 hypothetical protein CGCF245_v015677 [Colletotrichum fructicola]